jgi:hypothetical protein
MKITLEEWLKLHRMSKEACDALDRLESLLMDMMWKQHEAGNGAERELLRKLIEGLEKTSIPSAYMCRPQTEWTGGDSSNPANFTLREPSYVHMGKRFPREQVEAADAAGLLAGYARRKSKQQKHPKLENPTECKPELP